MVLKGEVLFVLHRSTIKLRWSTMVLRWSTIVLRCSTKDEKWPFILFNVLSVVYSNDFRFFVKTKPLRYEQITNHWNHPFYF